MTPKSSKSEKNEIRKSIKNQNDFKEPPKADLQAFGAARTLKITKKMILKRSPKMKKMIFGKVHISSALPMRERVRDLEKSSKVIENRSNLI